MTISLIHDAFGHHLWATDRLLETCTALTSEQARTPGPGTYGSILETFRHLVDADIFYLSVLTGEGGPTLRPDADLAEMRSRMTSIGAAWTALLARNLDAETDVVEIDEGWEVHVPMGLRLAQAVHHGTDHRSQICTVLTILGIDPPEIDVWAFAEATGRFRAAPAPTR